MTIEAKLVWCFWFPGEPEDGMLGFHTKKDRDDYQNGAPGPNEPQKDTN